MNTSYITNQTITDLFEKHPAAYNFLARENLKEERRQLTRELTWATDPRRIRWIEERLVTLQDWALTRLVSSLNRGKTGDLDNEERAELKAFLESGKICWSAAGAWAVIKTKPKKTGGL